MERILLINDILRCHHTDTYPETFHDQVDYALDLGKRLHSLLIAASLRDYLIINN